MRAIFSAPRRPSISRRLRFEPARRTPSAPNPSRDERGFTFIEVVFAISILVIVMGVAYGSLNYIIRTKKMLDDRRDLASVANSILTRMSREFQLALDERLLRPPGSPPSGIIPKFTGESGKLSNGEHGDSLSFMAEEGGQYVPNGATHSGIVMISYKVEEDPEQKNADEEHKTYVLVRDEVPRLNPPKRAFDNRMTFPLSNAVVSLEFQYFNANTEEWLDEWGAAQQNIPLLIRMTLALKSPLGRVERYSTVMPLPPGGL